MNTKFLNFIFRAMTLLVVPLFVMMAKTSASSFIPVRAQHLNSEALTVKVISVSNATVIVEAPDGKLLEKCQTDQDGISSIILNPVALASGVHITAFADGFNAVSLLSNTANAVEITLQKSQPDEYPILSGTLKGFDHTHGLGEAQVGIVAKAMSISDLGQLDSTAFVSPINDSIPVYGKRDIPSNIVLPEQWFMVSVVPVYVNKPQYRLPVLPGSSSRYLALSGTAKVKEVLIALQKNEGEKILNHLNVTRVGISEAVTPQSESLILNLETNVALTGLITLKGNGKAAPKGTRHVVGALWEPQDGVFVPTGVRFADAKDIILRTTADDKVRLLDLNLQDNGSRFRGEWLDTRKTKAVPESQLQTEIFVDRYDSKWSLQSTDTYDLMVARMSRKFKTKLKSYRIDDQWVVVAPFSKQFAMPVNAIKEMALQGEEINYLSVDLIKTQDGGYPYIDGAAVSKSLKVLEKVSKDFTVYFDGFNPERVFDLSSARPGRKPDFFENF